MNILEVIERERWTLPQMIDYDPSYGGECEYKLDKSNVKRHNAGLDRIAEAAKKLQAQVPKTVKPHTTGFLWMCECNDILNDDFQFCPGCGARLIWEDQP